MQSPDNASVVFPPLFPLTNTPPSSPCLCATSHIVALEPLKHIELDTNPNVQNLLFSTEGVSASSTNTTQIQVEERKGRASKLDFKEIDEV
jgi:hypothetical protein